MREGTSKYVTMCYNLIMFLLQKKLNKSITNHNDRLNRDNLTSFEITNFIVTTKCHRIYKYYVLLVNSITVNKSRTTFDYNVLLVNLLVKIKIKLFSLALYNFLLLF